MLKITPCAVPYANLIIYDKIFVIISSYYDKVFLELFSGFKKSDLTLVVIAAAMFVII